MIKGTALVSLVLIAPAASSAATICVRPAGGTCKATLQAAVDAAAPGDVVRVFPGVYFENVVVPPGRDGLRIVGTSRLHTIVDPDSPNTGPAFRIESNGVEVTALFVRNGADTGIVAASGVTRLSLHGLRFVGGHGAGAIRVDTSSTARVFDNEIRAAGHSGIRLLGGNDGSVVRRNAISQVDTAIEVLSNGVEVSANRISIVRSFGIRVEGSRTTVVQNLIEVGGGESRGLAVAGDGFTVRSNRLANAGPLVVSCTSCTSGLVASNSVVGSPYPSSSLAGRAGLAVTADAPGLVVRGNRVSRAIGPAYLVEGSSVRISGNLAIDTGAPDGGEGFLVRGPGAHQVDHNVATRCGASGFRVEADDVTLQENVSAGAGLSGFFVFGAGGTHSGALLRGNRAFDSNAAGFSVAGDAVATVLTGNSASRNRYDFCDDGTGTDVSGGNAFGTTSTVCDVLQ